MDCFDHSFPCDIFKKKLIKQFKQTGKIPGEFLPINKYNNFPTKNTARLSTRDYVGECQGDKCYKQ